MVDLSFFLGPFLIDLFFSILSFKIGLIDIICFNLFYLRLLQSHDLDHGLDKLNHINLGCYVFVLFN